MRCYSGVFMNVCTPLLVQQQAQCSELRWTAPGWYASVRAASVLNASAGSYDQLRYSSAVGVPSAAVDSYF
jgi:hypothetical protein